ncbi:MAG: hypothetical protein MGG11_15075 [Trichodesmium sp. MAG_R03]|nr:hypothetical protein [Trichodesmium sp. MAG_R03]
MPHITIVSESEINGANGAFAGETQTIYLAQEFVEDNFGDVGAIAFVIIEEYSHYFDGEVNSFDAPFNGTDVYSPSFIKAENNGTVTAKKLKTLKEVDLSVDHSKLNLLAVNSFSGKSDTVIQVRNEGKLTLGAKTISGDVDIAATGEGSVVNLPLFTNFNGTDVYSPSFIKAENNGTVTAKKLKTLKEVDLSADHSKLNLLAVNSFSGKSDTVIQVRNEGKLTLGAKTISGDVDIAATGEGSVVNLPLLTNFNGTDVYSPSFIKGENNGTVTAKKLKTLKKVDLSADHSKLNLLAVNSFSGKSDTVIQVRNEGKLTLGAKTISGDVDIAATGEGNVVNLPLLTNFNGTDVYSPSFIKGENNGTMTAKKLKTLKEVDLSADHSKLNFLAVNSFNDKSDAVIQARNEGKLTLGAKTISGDVDITPIGKDSIVDLPKLKRFLGKDTFEPSSIITKNGCQVEANKLTTVTNVDPFRYYYY